MGNFIWIELGIFKIFGCYLKMYNIWGKCYWVLIVEGNIVKEDRGIIYFSGIEKYFGYLV